MSDRAKGCLDELTIMNLIGNSLTPVQRIAALEHLDTCRSCSDLVAMIAVTRSRRARA